MRSFPTLALVTLFGCAPAPEAEEPSAASVETADTLTAQRVRVEAETVATAAAVQATGALSDILSDPAVQAHLDGLELPPAPETCFVPSLEDGDLVLDVSDCPGAEGSLTLTRDGSTVLVAFEDAFAWQGTDLDGQVALTVQLRERAVGIVGAVTYGADALEVDLGMALVDTTALVWGSAEVTAEVEGLPLTVRVYLGDEAAPLTFQRGCTCPVAGVFEAEIRATIDQVTVDLDDLLDPGDGQDDFPPLDIPITPVVAEALAGADFAGCGDATAFVEAEDLTVEVATADLQVVVDDACEAGEISEANCQRLDLALRTLPETLQADVPASALAEAAEATLQAAVDTLCSP